METTKKCSKCTFEKSINEFSLNKQSKDGHATICKLCKKEYREANSVKIKEYNNSWINNNPDYHTVYYTKNEDKIKEKKAEYLNSNPDRRKETLKKYRDNNSENIKKAQKNWCNNNPHVLSFRNTLKNSLIRFGKPKEGHTIDLLGYSALELKNHITTLFTDGMSWDNYGEWHIDHKKPVISFNKETPINIVNSLSNLQPLWATTREINGVIYEGNLNKNKY